MLDRASIALVRLCIGHKPRRQPRKLLLRLLSPFLSPEGTQGGILEPSEKEELYRAAGVPSWDGLQGASQEGLEEADSRLRWILANTPLDSPGE